MMLQRVAAFLMLAVQASAVCGTFGRLTVPIAVTVIALIGLPGKIEFNPPRDRKITLAAVLALVFTLQWLFFRPGTAAFGVIYAQGLGYPAALFCLAVQASMFFLRYEKGLPLYMMLYGTAALTWTGDVMRDDPFYAVGAFCYAAGAAAFIVLARSPWSLDRVRVRFRYVAACAAALAVSVALGLTVSILTRQHGNRLDELFAKLVVGNPVKPRIGFPSEARLGSVASLKNNKPTEVALRVVADREPGYLRGRGFDTYKERTWSTTVTARPLYPRINAEKLGIDPPSGCNVFELKESAQRLSDYADIHPAIDPDGALFASMSVSALASPADMMLHDQNGNMQVSAPDARARYRVYDNPPDHTLTPIDPELRSALTETPLDIDPRVRELASDIFAGCSTTYEKVGAVIGYFGRNYTYTIGIHPPRGQDPLTYFLLEKPPAHCEYFATGAAVLLRMADVPTRYVTGFVAAEHNPVGEYWVARNSDAHAWVEAYDEKDGWILVEATVAAGIPGDEKDRPSGTLAYLVDWLKFRLRELASIFSIRGILGVLRHLLFSLGLALLQHVGPGPIALLIAILTSFLGLRRFRRRARSPKKKTAPLIVALNKLLRVMDRHIARQGLYRTPAETIHSFARRIEAAIPEGAPISGTADWYTRYAGLRYSTTLTKDEIADLERSLYTHLKKR